MHSPGPAALLEVPELLLVVPDDPDCIETEGPFGPMLVEPLSPPGPVLIVVEFELPEPRVPEDLPCAVPFCATRHGLLLSTTIVVPPLSPVTIETLAPPALVLVVLSANAAEASDRAAAPASSVVAMNARIMSLLAIDLAR